MFFAAADERLTELQRLARDGDADGLRRVAHALRGAAANVGFAQVASRCAQLEAAPSEGDAPALAEVDRLAGEIGAAARASEPVVP